MNVCSYTTLASTNAKHYSKSSVVCGIRDLREMTVTTIVYSFSGFKSGKKHCVCSGKDRTCTPSNQPQTSAVQNERNGVSIPVPREKPDFTPVRYIFPYPMMPWSTMCCPMNPRMLEAMDRPLAVHHWSRVLQNLAKK